MRSAATKSSSLLASIWSYIQNGLKSIGESASRFDGLISMTNQPPSETPCQRDAESVASSVVLAADEVLHTISARGERKGSEATATFCTAGMVCSQ